MRTSSLYTSGVTNVSSLLTDHLIYSTFLASTSSWSTIGFSSNDDFKRTENFKIPTLERTSSTGSGPDGIVYNLCSRSSPSIVRKKSISMAKTVVSEGKNLVKSIGGYCWKSSIIIENSDIKTNDRIATSGNKLKGCTVLATDMIYLPEPMLSCLSCEELLAEESLSRHHKELVRQHSLMSKQDEKIQLQSNTSKQILAVRGFQKEKGKTAKIRKEVISLQAPQGMFRHLSQEKRDRLSSRLNSFPLSTSKSTNSFASISSGFGDLTCENRVSIPIDHDEGRTDDGPKLVRCRSQL